MSTIDSKHYLILVLEEKHASPEEQEALISIEKLGIQARHDATYHEVWLELLAPLSRVQIRELFKMKDEMGRICDFYERE
jgi:hypothetical protein